MWVAMSYGVPAADLAMLLTDCAVSGSGAGAVAPSMTLCRTRSSNSSSRLRPVAHVVFLGLLIAGIAVPGLLRQLLPRLMAITGLVIAMLAELLP